MFLVHPGSPRNVLRMGYRCSLLLKMNSPFCADAKCKGIPELSQHQDCSTARWLACAKKSIDFYLLRLCTYICSLEHCRDAGNVNFLFCMISSCPGDPFSCLEVLQEKGTESAVAESCAVGLFGCCCFLKLRKEPSSKTCWGNRAKENIKANTTVEMLPSPNNLLRIIFCFLHSTVCVHSTSLTNL